MKNQLPLADADIVRIAQGYYDAVDSLDGERLAGLYYPAPTTSLQFNADAPIVGLDAIRDFTNGFGKTLAGIRHTQIEVWTNPLIGGVVPVDLPPGRQASSVMVVSTALPIFSVGAGAALKRMALPATSIFTIDAATGKFLSVHNMFDIGKVYTAVQA